MWGRRPRRRGMRGSLPPPVEGVIVQEVGSFLKVLYIPDDAGSPQPKSPKLRGSAADGMGGADMGDLMHPR